MLTLYINNRLSESHYSLTELLGITCSPPTKLIGLEQNPDYQCDYQCSGLLLICVLDVSPWSAAIYSMYRCLLILVRFRFVVTALGGDT